MTAAGVQVVRDFWGRIEARDWDGVRALLADEVEIVWRHTGERFLGADNVVGMNRAYPEGWSIEVIRVLDARDAVVSEVRVPFRDETKFYVASLFEVEEGRIRRGVEYWIEAGHEAPPAWRRRFST